jgi:hypothetical protein
VLRCERQGILHWTAATNGQNTLLARVRHFALTRLGCLRKLFWGLSLAGAAIDAVADGAMARQTAAIGGELRR